MGGGPSQFGFDWIIAIVEVMRFSFVLATLLLLESALAILSKPKLRSSAKTSEIPLKLHFFNPCEFPTIDSCHPSMGLKHICDIDSLARYLAIIS